MRITVPIRRLTLLLAALLATLAVPAAAQAPPTNFSYRWESSNSGLTNLNVRALARHAFESSTLYVQTRGGTFKSNDNGRTWFLVYSNTWGYDAAFDSSHVATVYLLDNGQGVLKTTDGGVIWSQKNQGIPEELVGLWQAIAVAPSQPQTLYVGFGVNSGRPPSGGVYRSIDGAENWSSVGLVQEAINDIVVHPNNPLLVYVSSWMGLYTSHDGGDHWSVRHPDLPINVTGLVMDPHDPDIMYAGTWGDGIYKSIDAGVSWFLTGEPESPSATLGVSQLSMDPEWPYPVYAATGQGVYGTLNGGASWHNLGAVGIFSGVTFDPEAPGRGVLAGNLVVYGTGLHRGLRLDARQFLPVMLR